MLACLMPDYREVGTAIVNLRITYGLNRRRMSKTSVRIDVVDRCPRGYG